MKQQNYVTRLLNTSLRYFPFINEARVIIERPAIFNLLISGTNNFIRRCGAEKFVQQILQPIQYMETEMTLLNFI